MYRLSRRKMDRGQKLEPELYKPVLFVVNDNRPKIIRETTADIIQNPKYAVSEALPKSPELIKQLQMVHRMRNGNRIFTSD